MTRFTNPDRNEKKSCDTIRNLMISLETQRLTLRELNFSDAPFIVELLNEPSFLEYIGDKKVRTVTDAEMYLTEGPMASYARNGFGLLLVELLPSKVSIGICGLLQRETLAHPDVGFAFLPAFWGKGYAHEAAAAVLEDAHNRLRLNRVLGLTSLDNVASQKLLEKLGLQKEGIVHLTAEDSGTQLFAGNLNPK